MLAILDRVMEEVGPENADRPVSLRQQEGWEGERLMRQGGRKYSKRLHTEKHYTPVHVVASNHLLVFTPDLHEMRDCANTPDVDGRREGLQLYSFRSHVVWMVGDLIQLVTGLNVPRHTKVSYL